MQLSAAVPDYHDCIINTGHAGSTADMPRGIEFPNYI